MSQQIDHGTVSVVVDNLGGIESERLSIEPGVVALTGRNATNRTSLLRAIAAALGGTDAPLKIDADEGAVALEIDENRYERRYTRRDSTVRGTGDPYTDNAVIVDTFASLMKTNPVRRAVEQGDGHALRDVVMAPINTAHIQAEIEEVKRQRQATTNQIKEIEQERSRLPELERRRTDIRDSLATVTDDLVRTRSSVESHEADADAAEAAEEVIEALHEARAEREAARDERTTQRRSIEALEAERDEVMGALEQVSVPDDEHEAIEAELDRLQRRERQVSHSINSLLSIVEFNEDLIREDADATLPTEAEGDILAGLDPEAETVACWTCGSEVERGVIVEQLDDLRDVAAELRSERTALNEQISSLRDERQEHEHAVNEATSLRSRLDSIEQELDNRADRLDAVTSRIEALEDEISELEAEAADTEGLRDSDLLEQYQRLSELEYERGRLERDLTAVEEEIAELERLEDEKAALEADRKAHREELETLRTKIEGLEQSMVETFNQHAATVIDLLEYQNIERVWIERKAIDGSTTGSPESTFDLHIVRASEDGSAIEDTVDHLSESERELVGLIAALAGYLAHEVHETVPFMLLDSLEAIDASRIASLVDYFAEYVPYLIVALLPEDAAALDDSHHRIPMATSST